MSLPGEQNISFIQYSEVAIISYLGQSKPCFGEFLKNIMNVNACKMMKKKTGSYDLCTKF